MSLRNSTLLGVALAALTCSAAAQTTPPSPTPSAYRTAATRGAEAQPGGMARASNLLGSSVVDGSDKAVGEIKDILACDTGHLVVLIERESDDKLVATPLSVLTARLESRADRAVGDTNGDGVVVTDTAKVERFVLASPTVLATAPEVADRNKLDQAWWTAFGEHYAIKAVARDDTARHDAVGLSSLIGQDVKSVAGDVIGDVEDVAVDLADGTIAYVVISTGGVMGAGSALHGVRIDALKPDAERKFVTLQADKVTLERMTGINIDRLPARPSFEVGAAAPASTDRDAPARSTPR